MLDVLGRGDGRSRIALVILGFGASCIKMLTEGFSGNARKLQRFYREAAQTRALRHNNIVIVYDAGDQDGDPTSSWNDLVRGRTPGQAIQAPTAATRACAECRRADFACFGYAHARIHRDIKPANVIGAVRMDPSSCRLWHARDLSSITSTGSLLRFLYVHGSATVRGQLDP